MYVCVYVCVCTHTHTNTASPAQLNELHHYNTYIGVCMYVCMYVCVCVCVCVCVWPNLPSSMSSITRQLLAPAPGGAVETPSTAVTHGCRIPVSRRIPSRSRRSAARPQQPPTVPPTDSGPPPENGPPLPRRSGCGGGSLSLDPPRGRVSGWAPAGRS
jgi:hypothetical protein